MKNTNTTTMKFASFDNRLAIKSLVYGNHAEVGYVARPGDVINNILEHSWDEWCGNISYRDSIKVAGKEITGYLGGRIGDASNHIDDYDRELNAPAVRTAINAMKHGDLIEMELFSGYQNYTEVVLKWDQEYCVFRLIKVKHHKIMW